MTIVLHSSPRQLLTTLLDQPDLAETVQRLPPRTLGAVVRRVGLEDAGELVAFATPEQLLHVLDEDLWRAGEPGEDERLDAERLVTWLEVLLEAGEQALGEKLAALPEDLLTLALHQRLLVLETTTLATEVAEADDGDLVDKALSDSLHEELDDYILVARAADGWDAVLAAVLALDRDHHALLLRILARCAHLTADEVEEHGGLHAALSSEASLEDDVAGDREDRRAAMGYVAPSSAKSFLALAREPLPAGSFQRDPVTRAWFRELAASTAPAAVTSARALPSTTGRADALLAALAAPEARESPSAPRLAAGEAPAAPLLLTDAMTSLHASDPVAFAARSEELAYLANVLAAACPHRGRRMRAGEAVQAAVATCSLGLELAGGDAAATLAAREADALFRAAWHRLTTEVVSPATARLGRPRRAGRADPARNEALAALAEPCPWRAGALAGSRTFLSSRADLDAARAFLATFGTGRRNANARRS